MQYEDRISVDTPEGVAVEMTLAGVGSRFTAAIVDATIQTVLLLAFAALSALAASAAGSGGGFVIAGVAIGSFLSFFLYDVLFETLSNGRTPGKRMAGLRVVRVSGEPVGFLTSATRNLLRLVDILPTAYLVGIITILASPRNQRLGDMAAGTLVVRERSGGRRPPVPDLAVPAHDPASFATWDVSGVTADELSAVRSFLARRAQLTAESRSRLAWELAARLRQVVVGPDDDLHPEVFLERLVAAKAARG